MDSELDVCRSLLTFDQVRMFKDIDMQKFEYKFFDGKNLLGSPYGV